MEYRKLGRTGMDVSLICLGTMTWGNQNTEKQGHEQMDYALERGINFFDTAEMYAVPPSAQTYGKTEEIIGTWFAARQNRDKVILASKIAGPGLPWVRGGNSQINRASLNEALEGSLKRLQTDYIDLYQLHWPNRGSYAFQRHWDIAREYSFDKTQVLENFLEVLETMNDFIKAGKIRHIGLSNETAWGTAQWLGLSDRHTLPRMASIQNEYSLLCRQFEPELAEFAHAEECGLLAWSPLARGIISGKYIDGARPEGTRLTITPSAERRDTPQCNAAVKAYIDVAEKHGLDVCQMALAFVNRQPFVTANIIGATTMQQLKTNIDSIDVTLNDEVLADIETVRRDFPVPY
ncbi:MAG: aldo/keto reductase [Alphaproteobacteria bacterium]|nr:aldo/keto reductase [Alphaproteobacteria bacterium]